MTLCGVHIARLSSRFSSQLHCFTHTSAMMHDSIPYRVSMLPAIILARPTLFRHMDDAAYLIIPMNRKKRWAWTCAWLFSIAIQSSKSRGRKHVWQRSHRIRDIDLRRHRRQGPILRRCNCLANATNNCDHCGRICNQPIVDENVVLDQSERTNKGMRQHIRRSYMALQWSQLSTEFAHHLRSRTDAANGPPSAVREDAF